MTVYVSALVVAASLSLVLLVGPRWVLARPAGDVALPDRLPSDLVVGSVLVIITAEVLVILGLFEWLGLIVAAGCLAAVSRCRRARREQLRPAMDVISDQARALLYLLEAASEAGNQRVKQGVRRWWRELIRPVGVLTRFRPPAGELAWRLSLAAVLLGGLVVRGAHAFRHPALVPAGNYEQLTAMAELGEGRMFPYGAEPVGIRAVLASAAELTPASYSDVVRFAGPLLGTAAVAMVCLLVLRATNRRDAALVTAALGAAAGITSDASASVVGLADALAVLIALGGVAIAMYFAEAPTTARARGLGFAALGVVLVHPAALMVLLPAVMTAAVTAGIRQRRTVPVVQAFLAVGAGAMLGSLPVLAARLAGVGLTVVGESAISTVARTSPLVLMSLAGTALASVLVIGALRAGRSEGVRSAVLILSSVSWVAMQVDGRPAFVGDVPVPASLLAVGVGLGVACFRRWALVPLSGLALAALVVPVAVAGLPDFRHEVVEHDSAARAVSRRLAGVTDMSYTVVGSRVSLARVAGRTWRGELDAFSSMLSLEQAADPGFALPVPSDNVLLVTETWPLPAGEGARATGRAAEVAAQNALAHRVDAWMTVYARYHPGTSLLLEDTGVRVWYVKQVGDPELAERFRLVFR